MDGLLKDLAQSFCPPAAWEVLRRIWRPVARVLGLSVPPWRTISTLAELDAELERARRAVSFDASFEVLDGFQFAPPAGLPRDPASREYRDHQMAFYALISGRSDYRPDVCEQLDVDDDKWHHPFPYYTRSSKVVGEQLMAIGFLIRASAAPPGARVLEFGPGYGRLTLEMARLGLDVTAVEINPRYVDLVRWHANREALRVNVVGSAMLDYSPAERFDRVIFYECFHHCADHAAMIARLDGLVAPGGAVVFGGEPIADDFPMPWGLRRDGRSLWGIRLNGWLELGFRTDYFLDLLARHGWTARVHDSADAPWHRVFVARRARASS
jgi:SAM-dependent methyltransferase